MKVAKNDLVEGLKMVKGFCNAKSYPELGKVLIDGPGQKIIATDLQSWAEVSISLTDYRQKIVGEKPAVVHPDEDLTADLKSLKVGQLNDLCEYAGIDPGEKAKKADMVEKIFTASETSAQAEEKVPAPETEVDERFLVDPDHLLKIVNSEKVGGDVINLHVEEFEQSGDLLTEGVTATALAVGEHFQRIPLGDVNEFPKGQNFTGSLAGTINGDSLSSVTSVCPTKLDAPPHQKVVMFDTKEKNLVSTDGSRLHVLKHKFSAPKDLLLPANALIALAKIAKDKDLTMKVDQSGDQVQFSFGKLTVMIQNDDMSYPDYMSIAYGIPTVHDIEIDNEVFENLVKQVGLIAESAEFTFNGGLNAEAADEHKGEYRQFNVPFLSGKVDPEMIIRLNTGYIAQALKYLGKKVTMKLTDDPGRPVFFEGGNFKAAVMGMHS